jgi:NAD(P)-dependent dehydrogenase (short-subunit alcohol dehydrogenase family)
MASSEYDLTGKVVLITGATDGLGRALAREAARLGATVLVHGRSASRSAAVVDELPGARSYGADLASLDDVRGLAGAVLAGEERIDVLVNNAGIGADGGREESADGIELRFAVNYLAGYLLTRELLPLLRASAPARIVQVSSAGQTAIDFGDPMIEHGYSGMRAYCQSKLAQILHAIDLTETELGGSGVTANALHPSTYMPTKMVRTPMSTIADGVEATVRLMADPDVEGRSGLYFDVLRESRADAQAYDADARVALRELSERLVTRDAA